MEVCLLRLKKAKKDKKQILNFASDQIAAQSEDCLLRDSRERPRSPNGLHRIRKHPIQFILIYQQTNGDK